MADIHRIWNAWSRRGPSVPVRQRPADTLKVTAVDNTGASLDYLGRLNETPAAQGVHALACILSSGGSGGLEPGDSIYNVRYCWADPLLRRRAADPSVLSKLIGALHHRGPDGSGHAVMGRVALLHNRLAIIDLVTGDQPFFAGPATLGGERRDL